MFLRETGRENLLKKHQKEYFLANFGKNLLKKVQNPVFSTKRVKN